MSKIATTEERQLEVAASPAEVYAFFSRLESLSEVMEGVERFEALPEGQVRWVLEEKVGQGIRFQPDYVVAYEGNGTDHVACRSVEGNMANDWDVWIKPGPPGQHDPLPRDRRGRSAHHCSAGLPDQAPGGQGAAQRR